MVLKERFEAFSRELGRHYSIYAYCPKRGQFATLFLDVTERIRIEEALRNANENLEEKVQDRTRELDIVNETLIAQNILPRSEYAKGIDVIYSDEVITIQVNKYRELITELIDIVSVEKTDVSNIRDALVNIQEGIDKFVYQFDLE